MSKQRKAAPAKPVASTISNPQAVMSWELPAFFQNTRLQSGLFFVLAFLLYANTLGHGFVLDDGIVISDNMFTQKGVEGIPGILSKDTFFGYFKVEGKETLVSGGRYRPLTLVVFALVYQIAGNTPFVFHLLTILLFGLSCVLFYQVLRAMFTPRLGQQRANLLAWVAALLFTAHPIHTEVVANIKGCDEILTLLLSLVATNLAIRAYRQPSPVHSILAGLVFFGACLSKENAAAFVLLLPLALWYASPDDEANVLGRVIKTSIPVWVAFIAFFVLRGEILDWRFGGAPREWMNNPFLKIENGMWVDYSFGEKLAHCFYTLIKYIQLLIVPHPLTHDYYPPQIDVKSFSNPMALLSVFVYLGLASIAFLGLRKKTPLSFGIWAYLLPLSIVSNIVFPIGTSMGERFVFMSSAGFCVVVSVLLLHYIQQWKTIMVTTGVIAALFALKTITRNPVWESNSSLFLSDVRYSPNSAKMQNACAGTYFDLANKETDATQKEQYMRLSYEHAEKALKLHPTYSDVQMTHAAALYHLGEYDKAVASYRRLIQIEPENKNGKTYLGIALRDAGKYYGEKKGDLANALRNLNESWQINPSDPETARLLGVANGIQGKHAEAIQWFGKAVELAPDNANMLFELGNAYKIAGEMAKGEQLQQKAMSMDPKLKDRNK